MVASSPGGICITAWYLLYVMLWMTVEEVTVEEVIQKDLPHYEAMYKHIF